MTQDQIIQMLRKVVAENQNYTTWTVSTPHLVALVNHAINEEREACAKVAEQIEREIFNAVGDPRVSEFKPKIATAIRAIETKLKEKNHCSTNNHKENSNEETK